MKLNFTWFAIGDDVALLIQNTEFSEIQLELIKVKAEKTKFMTNKKYMNHIKVYLWKTPKCQNH